MTRFANSPQFRERLSKVLTPWSEVISSAGDPNFYGRTAEQYIANDDGVYRTINGFHRNGRSDKYIDDYLVDTQGLGRFEAENTRRDAINGKWQGRTRPLYMGVPPTVADERLSQLILNENGVAGTHPINGDNFFATDLRGSIDGEDRRIDAQSRRGALKIGILQNLHDVDRSLRQVPGDRKMKDLIDNIKRGTRGHKEDKLLHDLGLDIDHSQWAQRYGDDLHKDGIISSNRTGFQQPNTSMQVRDRDGSIRTLEGFRGNHGPYDPTLPRGWSYVDLNNVRDQIMDKSIDDLNNMGLGLRAGYGDRKLELVIPNRNLSDFSGEMTLNPDLVRAMSSR